MANEQLDRGGEAPRSIGEIAIRHHGGVPTVPALPPREPRLSEGLARLVEVARDPHPDVGLAGIFLPDHLRAEARMAHDRYHQLVEPAAVQRVFDWLSGVNARLASPLSRGDVMVRANAYTDTLSDIPEVCFNVDTRREAEVKFTFFPSAAEVHETLRPHALLLHAKRHVLRRLLALAAPEPTETLAEETQERREEILAEFRAKMDALAASRAVPEDDTPLAPQARYLTREQLTKAYAEQGLRMPGRVS